MKKQYFQSQYILNRVYNNTNNILRTTLNTSQDYLNAVFDTSKDAIRVNISGGTLPAVPSVDQLPATAADGQICPVLNEEKGCLDYYEYDIDTGQWIYRGSTSMGSEWDGDQKEALSWLSDHLEQIKNVVDYEYMVNVADITLPKDTTIIPVQGQMQNIDDDLNSDNDDMTPYRIDFKGYVINVSTYPNNEAIVPDRYYTKITYESSQGGLGMSHIYLAQDEYDYFANLDEGKNIIRVYYITNSRTSPIKRTRFILNPDKTVTDQDGNVIDVHDTSDNDGDVATVCCIKSNGYVLGIQTYASSQAVIMDKYYTKMVYESDGMHSGQSSIYIQEEQYDYFANLENGKNIMDLFYIATVFPAAITISETQFQLPLNDSGYVAIDASGNVHNIADDIDKDNDPTTHIRISMNGYVLDIDGYSEEDDSKKRIITKMSYSPELDSTDIYFDKDFYDYVSNLSNGKNIISVYTLGAGIGTDASRIPMVDSALDQNSDKAIQNKTVAKVIKDLQDKMAELENKLDQLS